MSRYRVVLAEDHAVMANALRALLAEAYDVAAVVADGEALLEAVATIGPDAVVCDIGLPSLSGLDAAERLLARASTLPIVIVTVRLDPSCVARALGMGVLAYVAKLDAGEELLPAMEAAFARRVYLSASVPTIALPAHARDKLSGSSGPDGP